MKNFTTQFTIPASVKTVSEFHRDTTILKRLTPPPTIVKVHEFDELYEGMVAKFTMWMGPIPLYWEAVHTNVSLNGFTDTQQKGPMKYWSHTHQFVEIAPDKTLIKEHVTYQHGDGLMGLFTHLAFNSVTLSFLFQYRKMVTIKGCKNQGCKNR